MVRNIFGSAVLAGLLWLSMVFIAAHHAPDELADMARLAIVLPAAMFLARDIFNLLFFRDANGERVPPARRIAGLRAAFCTQDYLTLLRTRGAPQEGHAETRIIPRSDTAMTLHAAAAAGRSELVESQLAAGENVNATDGGGWSPLLAAAARGHAAVVRSLLERGANPDAANPHGVTALMFAARYGNADIARALLERGAKKDLEDARGDTALTMAAANEQKEIIRLLAK
jgi:hypothetical protein